MIIFDFFSKVFRLVEHLSFWHLTISIYTLTPLTYSYLNFDVFYMVKMYLSVCCIRVIVPGEGGSTGVCLHRLYHKELDPHSARLSNWFLMNFHLSENKWCMLFIFSLFKHLSPYVFSCMYSYSQLYSTRL